MRANNYDTVYNKAYFIVRFTRIQAGHHEEKVTQSWQIYQKFLIDGNTKLSIESSLIPEIKKSCDRVLPPLTPDSGVFRHFVSRGCHLTRSHMDHGVQ